MSATILNHPEHRTPWRQLWQRVAGQWAHTTWSGNASQVKQNTGKMRLVCTQGILWVTFANDAHDYIVRAGESLAFTPANHIVVQGLGEANYRVEQCTA